MSRPEGAPQPRAVFRPSMAGSVSRSRLVVEILAIAITLALFGLAWRVDLPLLERHFSLSSRRSFVVTVDRLVLIALGLACAFVARPRVVRWVARVGAGEASAAFARVVIALGMALVASEVGLRILGLPRRYDVAIAARSMGEKSARYGWLFKASQSFTVPTGGRPIRYDLDAVHDRASAIDALPDPERPTILFVGESITAGHGLAWDESYPAIVGEALGLQVVDLGVDGYGSDQAFLRFVDALPRFAHPVAVVTLFIPGQLQRIARVDHPRLVFEGDGVELVPPTFFESLRLAQAFREGFAYDAEWAIQTTAEVFRETARRARDRGARAIFVAPCLSTDWPRSDGYLVNELLTRQGLTVVDPRFGFEPIPGDNHPNAASTRRLAEAVTSALRSELAQR